MGDPDERQQAPLPAGDGAVEPRDEPERWEVRATEQVLHDDSPFGVRRDLVAAPAGEATFWRLVVEHPGAVVVLAVDEDDRVLVLRQYRHGPGVRFVELPAGLLDQHGEDPLEAARRELLEEAGLTAEEWTHLSTIHTSPGVTDELVEVYLARRLRHVPDRGGFEPEHEEADMTLHWVPVADLLDAVLERRVTDGPLLTAVLVYAMHNGIRREGALGRPTR